MDYGGNACASHTELAFVLITSMTFCVTTNDEDQKIAKHGWWYWSKWFWCLYSSFTWWTNTYIFAIGHQRDECKPTWWLLKRMAKNPNVSKKGYLDGMLKRRWFAILNRSSRKTKKWMPSFQAMQQQTMTFIQEYIVG